MENAHTWLSRGYTLHVRINLPQGSFIGKMMILTGFDDLYGARIHTLCGAIQPELHQDKIFHKSTYDIDDDHREDVVDDEEEHSLPGDGDGVLHGRERKDATWV